MKSFSPKRGDNDTKTQRVTENKRKGENISVEKGHDSGRQWMVIDGAFKVLKILDGR